MIYVAIEGVKPEGCGSATGNGWQDTDDVGAAIAAELRRFHGMYDALGHAGIVTYRITVAPEASPRRTTTGAPLPVAPVQPSPQSTEAPEAGDTFSAVACPTCGGPCKVVSGDEGTSHYEPLRLGQSTEGGSK